MVELPGGPVAKTLPSNAGGPGSIPGQRTSSLIPQLRVCMPQLKILHAEVRIADPECCNYDLALPNKYIF